MAEKVEVIKSNTAVKHIENLRPIEREYVQSYQAANYLYGLGLLTEVEWERVMKRVHNFNERYNLNICSATYRLDLCYTLGEKPTEHP